MKCIIVLGAPGAGKGTQCALLQERLGLVHVSTGNLVRQEMKLGTPLGVRVKAVVDAGNLVDDETICACLEAELLRLGSSRSVGGKDGLSHDPVVLLDGLPRNLAQVGLLDETLSRLNMKVFCVLNFEVDLEILRGRFAKRYVCEYCQKVGSFELTELERENLKHDESAVGRPEDDVCTGSGAHRDDAGIPRHRWIKRPDDAPEVVDRRLKIYTEETQPVTSVYEKRGLLDNVSGLGAQEWVYAVAAGKIAGRLGRP